MTSPPIRRLLTVLIIITALMPDVTAVAQSPGPNSAVEVTLAPERLYVGRGQPIMLNLDAPATDRPLHIALLEHDGSIIAGPVPVRPGRMDLRETLPDVDRLERAAYVQIVRGDYAVGTALVVQPLLPPPQPQVRNVPQADGPDELRIVGWKRPQRAEAQPISADVEPETDDRDPSEPMRSGFRLYAERDVVLETSKGEIRIALRPDEAPNTAWNFRHLTDGGFYDGVVFHRVIPYTAAGDPFIIQSGDPTGTGRGGPGYTIPLEPSDLEHDFGVLSMARGREPHSAGSQFFITLSRDAGEDLDGQYCAFAEVVDGREALLAIAETELRDIARGRPETAPVITRARLVPAPPRQPTVGRPDRRAQREPDEPEPEPGRIPR